MKMIRITILFIILTLASTSCTGNNKSDLSNNIKNDFRKSMNAYQEIWKTKDMAKVEKLANIAFTNEELIKQVIESYKANLENDQGINITEKKYDVTVLEIDNEKAVLKVKANLKGYPISLSSGEKKIIKKQDFSFGPHNFEMKKEQGTWKISKF